MDLLLPNEKELKALRLFISTDETRQHLATLWSYASDGGTTYVATDGHTMAIRRSGTHQTIPLHDIAKLPPFAIDKKGETFKTATEPPRWDSVLCIPTGGKLADCYGMNPSYFARVGDVERAAGARAASEYQPKPGEAARIVKFRRADLKNGTLAMWKIPSDSMDGWYWQIKTSVALWEGLIMPRRV